jgi:hypothetical protein
LRTELLAAEMTSWRSADYMSQGMEACPNLTPELTSDKLAFEVAVSDGRNDAVKAGLAGGMRRPKGGARHLFRNAAIGPGLVKRQT